MDLQTKQHFLYKVGPAHLQVTHPDPDMFICKLFSNLEIFFFPVFDKWNSSQRIRDAAST